MSTQSRTFCPLKKNSTRLKQFNLALHNTIMYIVLVLPFNLQYIFLLSQGPKGGLIIQEPNAYIETVKSLICGEVFLRSPDSQVPLADNSRVVADRLQTFCNRRLI